MRSLLGILFVPVLAFGAVACGNGGGGGDRLGTEAFCERVEALGESTEELDEAEALAALAELEAQAPTDELRDALGTLAGIADQFADLDEDDPEDIGRAFEIIFNPEFLAAGEVIESYLTDECGFDPDDALFDDGDFGDDPGDFDDDFDTGPAGGLRAAVEDALPDVRIIATSTFTMNDEAFVTLTLGGDTGDPVEVCEAAAAYVDEEAGDDSTTIEVTESDSDDVVANRQPGGSCQAG